MMAGQPIRALVTGAGGQLGRELLGFRPDGIQLTGASHTDLDVTSLRQCRAAMRRIQPQVVIHCAAYTAVDAAESHAEAAYLTNADGTANIAQASMEAGAKLLYLSTDYVFDGEASAPYREDSPTGPHTVYGRSKLAGEQAVQALHGRAFIVRTSWVYGPHGKNFVKTMLRLGGEGRDIKVVNDQIGSPTYTYDLAETILQLIRTEGYGVYHASNAGSCSWYEFAEAVFALGGIAAQLRPCATSEYPQAAKRPRYSVMAQDALAAAGIAPLRPWREALAHMLARVQP